MMRFSYDKKSPKVSSLPISMLWSGNIMVEVGFIVLRGPHAEPPPPTRNTEGSAVTR